MSVRIRPPRAEDQEPWQGLFEAYLRFYRASVPRSALDATWRRILDPRSPVHGRVAESDTEGGLVGIAHLVLHESTWDERPSCYLEDLFVAPAARGSGAARALLEAVEGAAREAGAFQLYWLTQAYNGPARSLYDTVTRPSSYVVYQKAL